MAAEQIPNLNTLRNTRGGGRGRGRGLGGPSGPSFEEEKATKDKIVQQTDQDASVSRMSAVEAGYLDDPFASYFVSNGWQRKLPIINRGTYVRTKSIDKLVESFLLHHPYDMKQIISLGAGSDTRPFRLKSRSLQPSMIYHELDFPSNTAQKVALYKRCPQLYEFLDSPLTSARDQVFESEDSFHGTWYHLHPIDLRTLHPLVQPPESFKHIETGLPTLIISECCLCYLEPKSADDVVNYFLRRHFPPTTALGLVVYEPIEPNDAFGKVMVSNLASRGISLPSLRKYGSTDAQTERMGAYGFEDSAGADMNAMWELDTQEKEKERVAALEMMDEVEEWRLLAGHYCVFWGCKEGEKEDKEEEEKQAWKLWRDSVQ